MEQNSEKIIAAAENLRTAAGTEISDDFNAAGYTAQETGQGSYLYRRHSFASGHGVPLQGQEAGQAERCASDCCRLSPAYAGPF